MLERWTETLKTEMLTRDKLHNEDPRTDFA